MHLVLVDLRPSGITGARAEYILEEVNIACNKNTVPGDKSALNPSGIRLGTPALTTRGLVEKDMAQVVYFIDKALQLSKEVILTIVKSIIIIQTMILLIRFLSRLK